MNQYLMTKYLGVGNYGKVRLATNTETNKKVAIKIIPRSKFKSKLMPSGPMKKEGEEEKKEKEKEKVSGIEQEMKCLVEMVHRNVIALYEIMDDPDNQNVYLVMELCEGGTLADLLDASESGLPVEDVRRYMRNTLDALLYCHEVKRIAHRDIKPENIMLDKKDGEIKLCDFGVSDFFETKNDVLSGGTKGTYLFMAPEMMDRNKNKKAIKARQCDIWALGVTMYNLLTKDYPFKGRGLVELQ